MDNVIRNIGNYFDTKISILKTKHQAIETDKSFKKDLVCVINFETTSLALYIHSERELENLINCSWNKKFKKFFVVPNVENLLTLKTLSK
jgi:hypothetical protein